MTPILFRKDNQGIVFALFPTIPGSCSGLDCSSYEHFGQHGIADYSHCIQTSSPATKQEYIPLLEELEYIGYDDLRVYTRFGVGRSYDECNKELRRQREAYANV